MKSNEEYLDELLQSMSSDNIDDSALTRLNVSSGEKKERDEKSEEVVDVKMNQGKMDQQMIDELLKMNDEPKQETAEQEKGQDLEESSMLAQLMAEMQEESFSDDDSYEGEDIFASEREEGFEEEPAFESKEEYKEEPAFESEEEFEENPAFQEDAVAGELMLDREENLDEDAALSNKEAAKEEFLSDLEKNSKEENSLDGKQQSEEGLVLEKEDGLTSVENLMSAEDLEPDDDIEALLKAAQSTQELTELEPAFDIENENDLAEIEALLNMSDQDEIMDDNMELLQLLEAQDNEKIPLKDDEFKDADSSDAEVESLKKVLTGESKLDEDFDEEKESIESTKKNGKIKSFIQKIFSLLTEEIPDDDDTKLEKGISIYDENKAILKELDQEEEEKIKVKEKKSKKEKPKKEKTKKEKPKKTQKEKKVKVSEPSVAEKKLPKKKVIVTFVFAASVLALLLSIEFLVVPTISLKSARTAYDKGDYYEAYKEYYGHKLSEEDENRFQAAELIMRMQSNLDGYQNYKGLKNEVYALHSLLEAVHNKGSIFFKAEEYGVLSTVEAIYQEVLEILNNQYHISETEALEIIEEESDAVYTRKLEALTGQMDSSDTAPSEENQEDILPEEEAVLEVN